MVKVSRKNHGGNSSPRYGLLRNDFRPSIRGRTMKQMKKNKTCVMNSKVLWKVTITIQLKFLYLVFDYILFDRNFYLLHRRKYNRCKYK